MLIANPIYDSVFKYLLEDSKIAKELISNIIGENIVDLELKPQEITSESEKMNIIVYRLDFAAKIKNDLGEIKNVSIEIQKSKFGKDIFRFRNYLAEQYKKGEENPETKRKIALPIISIYFLGFNLESKIYSAIINVKRTYFDAVTGEIIEKTEQFIERLTHDCFVIQIPLLKQPFRNRLEKILSIFDQKQQIHDDKKLLDYKYKIDDTFIKYLLRRLGKAVSNSEIRQKMQVEDDIERVFEEEQYANALKLQAVIKQKDSIISEKENLLSEQAKLIEELKAQLNKKS